jgi:predicted Abi (CAAX) family protease
MNPSSPGIMKKMKITILPVTTPGKWSAGLLGGLVLFFVLLLVLVAAGQRGGETFFSNPALAITGLLAAACGIAAFFTGTISIVKSKERSISVFLASIIGLFVLVFCLGEVISPH